MTMMMRTILEILGLVCFLVLYRFYVSGLRFFGTCTRGPLPRSVFMRWISSAKSRCSSLRVEQMQQTTTFKLKRIGNYVTYIHVCIQIKLTGIDRKCAAA